ncbi:MAG: sulfate reduction electron transfer complex DsrMKJOP subunit DsrJ [Deltaproteobacteria bacterium]
MYDTGKIITGLIIFTGLMTFPIWKGESDTVPKLEKPTISRDCVAPIQYMRTSHMILLNQWRDTVLRDGDRAMVTVDGKQYKKGLMLACMKCHSDKKKFCDQCHTYASVKPYCWDCHFVPKDKETL